MAIRLWRRAEEQPKVEEKKEEKVVDDVLLQALRRGEKITREKVLTLPIVNSAVDFIANCVATMPVKLYKLKNGTVDELDNDNRVKLLNGDTGDTLDAFQLKKAMVTDYLLGKGGYCYIRWLKNEVVGLYYVEDTKINIIKNTHPIFKQYQITVFDKNYRSYEFIKLLRNTKDGASGEGITEQVSKALETAYQTLLYQLGMVATGGNKRGFLKASRKLGQEEINTLKKAWKNLYNNNNTENVVVLNNGLEFQEASASAVETQLNESKRTLKEEIETLFHIYPNDFNRTFKEAIRPIVKAFETALNRDLLLENEKKNHYFKFDMEEMTRVSAKERYEAYSIAKSTGFMTLNEMRKAENMEYVEGLDIINVGLGAVLYDINKCVFYTPNTDTISSMNDADDTMGEFEEDGIQMEELGGNEELEGIDADIDALEQELLGTVTVEEEVEKEQLEERYSSQYYDPQKAHEYYEQHKKTTGRKSTKGLNDEGKAAAKYVKEKLMAEKKQKIAEHKEQMNTKIQKLRDFYKKLDKDARAEKKEEIYAEIAKLRNENKATKNALKEEYDNKYLDELDKIKADTTMQKVSKKKK